MGFLEQTSLDFLAHPAAIASLVLLVVLFLYWYGTRGFAALKILNVPGPKPIPFLGNFLEARKYGALHIMHLDYLKKYGKLYTLCMGGKPSLVVADPLRVVEADNDQRFSKLSQSFRSSKGGHLR